jgi:putative membrane protein
MKNHQYQNNPHAVRRRTFVNLAKHLLLALLVSGLMVLPGMAQSSSNNQSNSQSAEQAAQTSNSGKHERNEMKAGAMTPQAFLNYAAQDDLAEIQLAKIVDQKSNDNNLKQMAQKLGSDHQQNLQKLQQIAEQQGVTLPDKLDAKRQAKLDRLSKLSGSEFDKAYVREQVKDHRKDIAKFQKEEASTNNPAIKSFASETLGTLQKHLQIAESNAQQLGVTVSGMHHQNGSETARATQHQQSMR